MYNFKQKCADANVAEWAGIFIAILLGVLALWQLFLMRESNETATRSMTTGLRAYVLPKQARLVNLESNSGLKAELTIANYGQTPATNVTVDLSHQWLEVKPFHEMGLPQGPQRIPFQLAPGEQIVLIEEISDARRDELFARKYLLQLVGTIRYSDVFGESHSELVEYTQGGDFDPHSQLMTPSNIQPTGRLRVEDRPDFGR